MINHKQSPKTPKLPHRLVPDYILEQYAAGEQSGRFPAVALFVDTSGFTQLTAQLQTHATAGTEVLANVLLAVFEPLIRAVYANGGFVAGFAGDAFKAIFPTTDQRSYMAALTTARDIREHMAAQAVQKTPFGDFPFAVRTSIASGDVEWVIWRDDHASGEDSQRAIYTFGGEALDAAVYGESLAQAGDLIVTEAARMVFEHIEQFTAESLAEAAQYARVTNVGLLAVSQVPTAMLPESASETKIEALTPFYAHDLVMQTSQGEFRRVLTLFINLQTLPTAEEKTRFTTTFFSLLERYGGYVCRLGRIGALDAGGTLLLFWGAPTSHENDVERVLNFILDLQARVEIPLRAGITYQIAYAGFVGSPLREEYTCYGLSVNLAARLMTGAPWDSIWVDEAITKRAKKLFRLEHVGDQLFKGFSEPLPVHQLRRRRAMLSTLFFKDQMVGRQRELLQLAAMLAPVQNGRFGGVITIDGEAGIGKSHLIHECLHKIDFISRGELFLCQCDEILRESLNPFRYFLRHYFEQRVTQSEEQNRVRFESILDALIVDMEDEPALRVELERTRSFLGALIGLHWADSLYAQSPPKLRQENTFIALKTLIKAESLRRPVVIQIEDAHWLDDSSRQFLLELTRNVSAFPFIILITTRDTEGSLALADGVSQRQIHLQALDAKSVTNLAQTLLHGPVSTELSDLIIGQTDGNPFFVEQFVIFLREQQMLQAGEGGLRPVAAVSTLPTDLQAILVARIDQLTQQVRHVVQTAAILGREFDVQILSQMLQNEIALSEKIKAAESFAIWSALSELYYLFKHALLRDAAYNMQLQAQRQQLHQVAAAAITAIYRADLSLYYMDLAYHYRQAEDTENERHFAFLAGQQAAERFSNDQAVDYFSRSLTLTADAVERFPILQARIDVYTRLGQRDNEQVDIEEMHQLAETIVDEQQHYRQAQAALARARVGEGTGDYAATERDAAEAVRLAQLAKDSETETQGLLRLIIAIWFQGRYDEAREHAFTMLSVARAETLPISEGHALLQLGNVNFLEGTYTEAQQYYEQALAIYRTHNHAVGEAPALSNLGLVSKHIAADQAKAYFEQALTINRQMGSRQGITHALSSLAGLELDGGNYEAALRQTELILPLAKEINDRNSEMYCLTLFANTYNRLGDYAQAEAYALEEIRLCDELNNQRSKCMGVMRHGLILYLRGDFRQAVEKHQAAVAIAEELDMAQVKVAPLIYLGYALTEWGRLTEASQYYHEASTLVEQVNEPNRQIELLTGMVDLALRQNDVAQAAVYGQQLITLLQENALETRVEEPVKVYLTCYVLLTTQRNRQDAAEMLAKGHAFLQKRAALIADDERRQRFLYGVVAHRRLMEIYEGTG